MSGEFNIHAARRIEARQLAALREASAVQRSQDIYALRRAAAARGGAVSGGLLNEELRIICAEAEKMIETAIANRKELSRSAPELLMDPYLTKFHRVLDEMAGGVEIAVQQLHASPSHAGQFPAAALGAVLRDAQSRAKTLKDRIDIDIQKMALQGTAHRQTLQITNVFHAPVSNVSQQSSHVNQTVTTGPGNTKKVNMQNNGFWIANWEKLISFAFGVVFVGVLLSIAFLVPNPTDTQWFVFRVVLALAAAGIAAIIPGLIVVNASKVVRAGGAIALFVLVYWFNPPRLVVSEKPARVPIQQTTGGENSPAVVAGGDVVITNEKKSNKDAGKK